MRAQSFRAYSLRVQSLTTVQQVSIVDSSEARAFAELTFISNGGEMAERVRAFDWSQTSIGGPEGWSPALRTMLGILLANRFPHLLWWGPDYIQIYNDAYIPVPGAKHPHRSLGRPAKECWNEIWHILQPLIDRPFFGGPATWSDDIMLEINRCGFMEESHFTIAYSPVPDETVEGGIGGVLATVHEITQKVVGERRVVALRDLGASLAHARTAEEACAFASEALATHGRDIPFALLYLTERDGQCARLSGSAGVKGVSDFNPSVVELQGSAEKWPFLKARETGSMQVVDDLGSRFSRVPAGPWADSPTTAVVLPLPSSRPHEPAGFLVAGVSARLKLDDFYRDFFDLARAHIATAIGNARAYEEEKKRAEALAEIDRAKTAFFSNISHEFRTPLTLMLSPLEELSRQSAGMPNEQLELINRNGRRLLRLVDTLLDFSRIEAGRIKASYEPIDLGTFTAELASVFRAATERAGLKLLVDSPPMAEPVYVDREMWEKIVLNLLSNAFKFTFEGQIEITTRRFAANLASKTACNGDGKAEGLVELLVRDTGVGIPAEEMPRLFERFHRVETTRSRTHEGSGIGLALVLELVKLHGGTVTAQSTPGSGTTFSVRIPLGTAHLPPERIASSQNATSTSQAAPFLEEALRWLPDADELHSPLPTVADSASLTVPSPAASGGGFILFADDNADMRLYVKRLLSARYEVETVPHGLAALARAQERRPDVILSDAMMPELDGFGLVRELRRDPLLRGIPVILLSARAGEESRVEGLAEGADDYLVKPFSSRELLARVESVLQLARLRREAETSTQRRAMQFETLLNQAPLGVYLVDADFRLAQVNPAARPVFGNIPELIGRDFGEVMRILWPREFADQLVALFRHTLETGEPYQTSDVSEYRVDRQTTEYYEWRIDRITLPDGRCGVVCYFRDISERKRREANLSFLARLSMDFASRATPEQVLSIAASALQQAYRAKRVVFMEVNEERGLLTPLGSSSEVEALGAEGPNRISDLLGDTALRKIRSGSIVAVEDVRTDPDTASQAAAFEARGARSLLLAPYCATGRSTFLSWVSRDTPGAWHRDELELMEEVSGRVCLRYDRALAEQALAQARDELGAHAEILERTVAERTEHLRATVHELEAFSYSIAHDMRAPLRAMQGFATMLEEDFGSTLAPEGKEYLRRLATSAVRLDALIRDVLNYSKIARGELPLTRVAPMELIQEIVESYPNLHATQIQLGATLPPVLANRAALTQVVSNLLGNAVKFVPKGVEPHVNVWGEPRGAWLRIWFEDNGIGIRREAQERIFLMFQRLNSPAEYEGTGIGLTIVKKAMSRMGGTVGVESEPGNGSKFWIELKRGDEE